MGYPSGIQTFTNKTAGQVIQPAHVNDLQTEITAIETDLINGFTNKVTANNGLQSSASTVASLQVDGASTFANGTITISTQTYVFPSSRATAGDVLTVASTSGSTATLQWQAGATRPVCLVRHSAVQQVAANVWTSLDWDTEDKDASGMHSTSANSSRITFAHSTGTYAIGVSLKWGGGAGSTSGELVVIRYNDTIALAGGMTFHREASMDKPVTVTTLLEVGSTADYITVAVQPGSSTQRIQDSTASTFGGPRFWAHKLG